MTDSEHETLVTVAQGVAANLAISREMLKALQQEPSSDFSEAMTALARRLLAIETRLETLPTLVAKEVVKLLRPHM